MSSSVSSNVVLLVVVGVVALALILWFLAASRRARVDITPRAEDEPARRNQTLIDAPPVIAAPVPLMPDLPALEPADSDVAAPAAMIDAAPSDLDDLTLIKGVGPKLADTLRIMGITTYAQIAGWDDAEIERVDAQLGRFQGRIRRDDWPAQARLLAAGETTAYEAKFGRL